MINRSIQNYACTSAHDSTKQKCLWSANNSIINTFFFGNIALVLHNGTWGKFIFTNEKDVQKIYTNHIHTENISIFFISA